MTDDCNITGLARKQKKQREPLGPAAAGQVLPASKATALPGASAASGVKSPLTEQEYDGDTWYQFVSSDGLFVFEYPDQTEYIDGDGNSLVVVHLDKTPAPP